jgi:hypothetical protein
MASTMELSEQTKQSLLSRGVNKRNAILCLVFYLSLRAIWTEMSGIQQWASPPILATNISPITTSTKQKLVGVIQSNRTATMVLPKEADSQTNDFQHAVAYQSYNSSKSTNSTNRVRDAITTESENGTNSSKSTNSTDRSKTSHSVPDAITMKKEDAAIVVDEPLTAAYYPPGNGTSGNSSLPQTSDLRVVEHNTRDPSLRGSPSQAAVLDDPRAAHYPPGVSTRGNSSLPHISGLRIAFVGDSLTRYMYLSLAAYLRRSRWVGEKDVPNMIEEKQFGGWNLFYNYTKNYFRPYEQCDCFRAKNPKDTTKGIENRYFHDPVRDNVLYYFQK